MLEQKSRQPLLRVNRLKTYFPIRNAFGRTVNEVKAVDDVTFHLFEGETYGLVGESGCGKSTTGRTMIQLVKATEGECLYEGVNIWNANAKKQQEIRKKIQMVFQDPYSSLNPRKRIGTVLEEPLIIHNMGKSKEERRDRVLELLHQVGLQEESYYRFPHEFSGGQRQRIGLARALAVDPKVIICDEPVSALDVSIQSQVINLLQDIQQQNGLTYLFIAHDLSVVRHISDRVGVMYLGRLVEEAPTEQLFSHPQHPYTKALLSAIPTTSINRKRERILLGGEVPSPIHPPSGCAFHTRCPFVQNLCKTSKPSYKEVSPQHFASCHLYEV